MGTCERLARRKRTGASKALLSACRLRLLGPHLARSQAL